MAAKFEISQPSPGRYTWVLTNQGRVLAQGGTYTRKVSCVNGLQSFRKAAPSAAVLDLTEIKLPPAKTVPGKAARATGRGLGKAISKMAQVVEKVEDAVPVPRKRAPRAQKA
jgi:uncharacterized protein YegP (UPF0339 family)